MSDVQRFSRSRDGNRQLSPNFRVAEFASRCGTDEVLISTRLISVLQNIRNWTGLPVNINSGYRSPTHNRAVGGATNSLHMQGTAADITIRGVSPTDVARWAEAALRQAGIAGGICVYPTFTHIDVRPNRWRAQQQRVGGPLVNNNGWTPMPIQNVPTPQPTTPIQPSFQEYQARISTKRDPLRVRTGAGTNHAQVRDANGKFVFLQKGTTVTILEESPGIGSVRGWGRARNSSGSILGWVALDFTERV